MSDAPLKCRSVLIMPPCYMEQTSPTTFRITVKRVATSETRGVLLLNGVRFGPVERDETVTKVGDGIYDVHLDGPPTPVYT